MITIRLQGGLGNQMFQYAAGRALALRHKTELCLDLGWYQYEGKNATAKRLVELDHFNIQARQSLYDRRLLAIWEGRRSKLWRVAFPASWKVPMLTVIRKPDEMTTFDPAITDAPDNSLLMGFVQSEKYFADQAAVIRQELTVKSPLEGANKRLAKQIAGENAVSLHVRRGDYVSDEITNAFNGTTTLEYYQAAIKRVSQDVKQPTFYIFSDEPDWCRANLKLDYPTTYVEHNGGPKAFEDIRLMSLCRHNIIANSSFSWWGAWLNPNPKKLVIAPKRWFANAKLDSRDIIPESWVRL